jgi:hypothetical protein
MTTMKGTVKAIKTKDWNGKTMYNLGVNTGGEKLEWVGFGTNNPGVREESVVSFEYKQNDKGFLVGNAKTINVHKDEKPAVQAKATGGGFQDRQSSITLQTAFKVATEQAGDLLSSGLFKPATNTKAAKETAIDAYFALVDKIASRLHGNFMNPENFEAKVLEEATPDDDNVEQQTSSDEPFEDEIPF